MSQIIAYTILSEFIEKYQYDVTKESKQHSVLEQILVELRHRNNCRYRLPLRTPRAVVRTEIRHNWWCNRMCRKSGIVQLLRIKTRHLQFKNIPCVYNYVRVWRVCLHCKYASFM